MKIKILFISLFIALLNLNPAQAHTELVSVEPSGAITPPEQRQTHPLTTH